MNESTLCDENESYQEVNSPIYAHRAHHHHNALGAQKNGHFDKNT